MTELVTHARIRRTIAVGGENGIRLGLDLVPGVVLADYTTDRPGRWMPLGHHFVVVWAVCAPEQVWKAIDASPGTADMRVMVQVRRPNRWPWSWARWRAWWRWQVRRRA